MSKPTYLEPCDVTLERINLPGESVIKVFDEEGDVRLTLPDSLSDSEAKSVIRLINRIYGDGFERGEAARSRQILMLLGGEPKND